MFRFNMVAISTIIKQDFGGANSLGFRIIYTDQSGSASLGPEILAALSLPPPDVNVNAAVDPHYGSFTFNNTVGDVARFYSTTLIPVKDNTSISYSYFQETSGAFGAYGTASFYTDVSLERLTNN